MISAENPLRWRNRATEAVRDGVGRPPSAESLLVIARRANCSSPSSYTSSRTSRTSCGSTPLISSSLLRRYDPIGFVRRRPLAQAVANRRSFRYPSSFNRSRATRNSAPVNPLTASRRASSALVLSRAVRRRTPALYAASGDLGFSEAFVREAVPCLLRSRIDPPRSRSLEP